MWYVFEGADLTGKSSIAEQFSSIIGIPIFKTQRPSDLEDTAAWDECVRIEMDRMEAIIDEDWIFDRTVFISNPVYGIVFGRPPRVELISEVIAWGNPIIIIHCFADLESKLLRSRSEEKYDLKVYDKYITAGYDKMLNAVPGIFGEIPWTILRMNTTQYSIEYYVKCLITKLDEIGELKCAPSHSGHLSKWKIQMPLIFPIPISIRLKQ